MDQSRENHNWHPSHHSVLKFIIPVLVGLIQIKAAGNQPSVFETHSALVWMFVGAILAYIIVSIAQPHFPNLSAPLQLMSKFFASTSITSLVFILFPPLKWEILASYFVSLFLLTIWLLLYKLLFHNSWRDQDPVLPITRPTST